MARQVVWVVTVTVREGAFEENSVSYPVAAFGSKEAAEQFIEADKQDPDGSIPPESSVEVDWVDYFEQPPSRGMDELRAAYLD